LTYIVAYADMLNRDANELSYDEMKSFLNGINVGADRLRRLIENFILLVELETGEAKHNFDWRKRSFCDFESLLHLVAEASRSYAEEKGVRLEIKPITATLPDVVVDQEYLKAALGRLVDNAIKFSDKPDSVVEISATLENGSVCLNVIDHGRGVPIAEQATIFEIFYQINRQAFEDQGAGAGLPIVRKIAELHGGSASLESVQGQGSRFSIHLPVAQITETN
jgi:two-component system, sensor histidine kinase and response regulator